MNIIWILKCEYLKDKLILQISAAQLRLCSADSYYAQYKRNNFAWRNRRTQMRTCVPASVVTFVVLVVATRKSRFIFIRGPWRLSMPGFKAPKFVCLKLTLGRKFVPVEKFATMCISVFHFSNQCHWMSAQLVNKCKKCWVNMNWTVYESGGFLCQSLSANCPMVNFESQTIGESQILARWER